MILRFRLDATEEQVEELVQRLEGAGCRTRRSPEPGRAIVALLDRPPAALAAELARHPLVEEVVAPKGDLRLVHRSFHEQPTVVRAGGLEIGGPGVVVIAGPCSVEGRDFMDEVAGHCARAGAHMLRGGAYKPRTSPYSFQGFGVEGLAQLKDAGERHGLPVVSEIMDGAHLPAFLDHDVDCLQIGARNMQNFTLLKAVAAAGRPVLLKRGLAGTVEEWLYSAEYLCAFGCPQVILCERGIRTYEPATRNTLDLTILPLLRELTHLPVIVDPAHAVGVARFIPPLARAAVAAGADGITVEVHPRPEEARSDGPQALLPGELAGLVADLRVLAAVGGRGLAD
ncbi:MAG: 3-deoxy-7-phosphoheptulonate synthase [Planctomycetota bacterium]|nr:MAG: 3-deoxy-7-phosphoheptulonate synthase [Planctomycetota bacterium]